MHKRLRRADDTASQPVKAPKLVSRQQLLPFPAELGDGTSRNPYRLPLQNTPNESSCLHCPTPTCHCVWFAEQLARCYASLSLKRETERTKKREFCAKSILPPFVTRLVRIGNIDPEETFYDLGCGNGSVLFQVAAMTGARCVGVEINPHNAQLATEAWSFLRPIFEAQFKHKLSVEIVCADFCTLLRDTAYFPTPCVIWAANLLLPKPVNHYLSERLRSVPRGTRIMCFEDLYPHSRSLSRLRDPDAFEKFDMLDYEWQPDSVEWCSQTGFSSLLYVTFGGAEQKKRPNDCLRRVLYDMLFLARDGMRGHLVDVEAQTVLRNYAIGEVAKNALVYSPISQAVIAHQARNCALFLSAATQQPLQRSFTPELVTSCGVTRCGTFMVAGTASGTILLWNLQSGDLIKSYKGHLRAVHSTAISADDSLVATASEDSVCKVWNLATLASLRVREVVPRCIFNGHSLAATCCTFLHYSNVLLTGSSDRTCRLVDTNTGAQLRCITVGDAVTAVAAGLDDSSIVVGTQNGFLFFSDLYEPSVGPALPSQRRSGLREPILRPPSTDAHHSPVIFLQCLPSTPSLVLTASEGGAVLWFDIRNGRLVKECISPQKGRLLACCVVPRAALLVKSICAPLQKNPIDPSRGNYRITQCALTTSDDKRGVKRDRISEECVRLGTDEQAEVNALANVRAKIEELRGLRAQLQRRLHKLSVPHSV